MAAFGDPKSKSEYFKEGKQGQVFRFNTEVKPTGPSNTVHSEHGVVPSSGRKTKPAVKALVCMIVLPIVWIVLSMLGATMHW